MSFQETELNEEFAKKEQRMREEFARKLKQAEDEFKRKEDEVRERGLGAGDFRAMGAWWGSDELGDCGM